MPKKVIDSRALERAHKQLVRKVGGDVSWSEFAGKVGVSLNTLTNIRHGHTTGSISTVKQIVLGLQREGVKIAEDDLLKTV